jgi:homoserine O-succinyltransferase
LDQIERLSLGQKCFGTFPCEVKAGHSLLEGVSSPIWVQHSRWNNMDARQVKAAGYTILTNSERAGIDMFVKEGKCLLLFLQGHPEYETDTLMREYRRDVGRFLSFQSDRYPTLPEGCLEKDAMTALSEFRDRAISDRRTELLCELPTKTRTPGQPRGAACRIYRNWLLTLVARKAQRRPSFLRRTALALAN